MSERSEAVAYARAQLDKDYCHAGIGPECFDCSGLTYRAYHEAGVTIARGSAAQWDNARFAGQDIPVSQAKPGDLIFWGKGQCSHVGIVSKPGYVINAMDVGLGVKETAIGGSYGVPLLGAASILATESSPATPPEPTSSSEEKPDPKDRRRKKRRKEDRR